jgi:hypothetical protein
MSIGIALLLALRLTGCCSPQSLVEDQDHDPQKLQIYVHMGYHDDIDTFQGFLQKDLVPETIRIPFWLSTREQEIILDKLERCRFLSFPDTIRGEPGRTQSPDFGAQVIRVKYGDKEKSVVWSGPPERSFKYMSLLYAIRSLIFDIAVSRPEYKALPQAKGGFQ